MGSSLTAALSLVRRVTSATERGKRVGVNDIAPAGTVHGMTSTENRLA